MLAVAMTGAGLGLTVGLVGTVAAFGARDRTISAIAAAASLALLLWLLLSI